MIAFHEFTTTLYQLPFDDDVTLQVKALKDYNQAIDLVCERLQALDKQSAKDIEKWAPYFGHIWPSCLGLVKALKDQVLVQKPASSLRVLELGCGLAIPSLYLNKKGVETVVCLDAHPLVEDFLKINQDLNGTHVEYLCSFWEECGDDFFKRLRPNLVIAADVLYEYQQVFSLSKNFAGLRDLIDYPFEIVVTDPGRTYLQKFFDEMKRLGFHSTMDIQSITTEDLKQQDIFILTFKAHEGL